jgi:hypothetical protein
MRDYCKDELYFHFDTGWGYFWRSADDLDETRDYDRNTREPIDRSNIGNGARILAAYLLAEMTDPTYIQGTSTDTTYGN